MRRNKIGLADGRISCFRTKTSVSGLVERILYVTLTVGLSTAFDNSIVSRSGTHDWLNTNGHVNTRMSTLRAKDRKRIQIYMIRVETQKMTSCRRKHDET